MKYTEFYEHLERNQIPHVLYHATFAALAKRIEREGIIAGGKDIRHFPDSEKGVYLGIDADYAGSMAEAAIDENPNIPEEWYDEIVIISIDTSKLDLTKLDRDPHVLPQDDEYDDSIPPDETIYSFIYRGNIPKEAIISIDDYI